eukprot:4288854-Karenia_brevis.AAC.1
MPLQSVSKASNQLAGQSMARSKAVPDIQIIRPTSATHRRFYVDLGDSIVLDLKRQYQGPVKRGLCPPSGGIKINRLSLIPKVVRR